MPVVARGYGAYISCDGQEVKSYRIKVEDKVASCYVLNTPGRDYRVHWVDSKPPTHLSVEVRVDGRRIGVVSHTKGSSKASSSGLRVALEAHDLSHAAPHDALPSAFSEEVGTLEVRLRRVRDFVAVPVPSKAAYARRSTKNSTASVAAGKRQGTPQKLVTVLRPILIDDKPYVIFRFMYRTQDYLEANGIADSGPRPSPNLNTTPSTSKGRQKKRASETSCAAPVDEPPTKRQRKSTKEQDPPFTSNEPNEPYPDDDMYLGPPQDFGEPPDISPDAVAAPSEAVGDLVQHTESCSSACNAVQPSEHTNGSDDEDERMVEMHLSACKGLSQPEIDIGRVMNVKTEVMEPALHIKHEPDLDGAVPSSYVMPVENGAEPPGTEETVVEIHVSSRNQHVIFGAPVPAKVVKKEEETESPLVPDVIGRGEYLVKTEEQESSVIEVHLSAANLQEAFTGLTSMSVKQER